VSDSRSGAAAGDRSAAPPGGNPFAGRTGGNLSTGSGPIPRARFRAWLVTGPIGRLAGFFLDFARELWRLLRHR